jgi:MFS family permease
MDRHDRTLPGTDATRRRGRLFLSAAVACVGFALALQMGLNANFLSDDLKLTGAQLGILEAFRESCGIWALGVLALLAGYAEPLVGAAMLALFAVGLGGYALVPDFFWVIALSLVWSQGLHVWMPLPASMALGLAEPGRAGLRLGQIQSAGAAGFFGGLAGGYLLTRLGVPIRPLYYVAAAMGLLAAGCCLGIPRGIRTQGPRLVFRRRYGLYYLLCFLEGWRKQIFICFAPFLLVQKCGTPLTTILALNAVVQIIGCVTGPMVGRLIDRVGERRVLVFYFACLTSFFVGYARIETPWLLYALFVADSSFFVFAMALNTYVNRLVVERERTPTLSMGVAMNHAAAVSMPLVGGALWVTLGPQWTFLAGALAAALSVIVALRVPAFVPTPIGPTATGDATPAKAPLAP